jgi:NADH-quinone oxidoreductase subunit A
MLTLAALLAPKNFSNEKTSVYECGFEPFSDARSSFDIHFYIVAILFIIFDIEIIFLIPWVIALPTINTVGLISMFIFLFLFLIGLILEFKTNIIN